jgi:hypothetical protein
MVNKIAVVLCLFLLAGCGVTGGRGSRLYPWNWFAPDRATQLQDQHQTTVGAGDKLTDEAHRDLNKTVETLRKDPAPNEYNRQALHFASHGLGLLDQVRQLPFAWLQEDQELVAGLFSNDPAIRAAAQKKQDGAEDRAAKLAGELADSKRREDALTTKLEESDKRYQAEAESARRTKFIIYGLIALWLLGNVVSKLAQANPAFAGAAKVFGAVAMPVLSAAKDRAVEGLWKVGHAFAELRAELPPDTAENVTRIFDDHLDSDHKQLVAAAATSAPRQ